jgi:hypothetical protein
METKMTAKGIAALNMLMGDRGANLFEVAKEIVKVGSVDDIQEVVDFMEAYAQRCNDFVDLVRSTVNAKKLIAENTAIIDEEF